MSTIAFFGLGIKATGALDTAWVGYQEYIGDDAAAVTDAAHDRGVRVVPTFQLFDTASGAPRCPPSSIAPRRRIDSSAKRST